MYIYIYIYTHIHYDTTNKNDNNNKAGDVFKKIVKKLKEVIGTDFPQRVYE